MLSSKAEQDEVFESPNGLHSAPAEAFVARYLDRLTSALHAPAWSGVARLAEALRHARDTGKHVFLCGNGGSAANAIHLANDFLYGVSRYHGKAIRVTALSANASVVTCLANDVGYDEVFRQQLRVLAQTGDVLIVLSGSGNSANVVNAIVFAKTLGMQTFAILGFDGGQCRDLADHAIHFDVDDMQISEDLQSIVGHIVVQALTHS